MKTSSRLDKAIMLLHPDFSRSRIEGLIKAGFVTVNGAVATKAGQKVCDDDDLSVEIPPPVPAIPEPENIPLEIVHEDDDIVVVNKAPGMVVHPAPGHFTGTLVNALLAHCPALKGIGGVARPGIVHRLDMDTSGLVVVAKSQRAMDGLVRAFSSHTGVEKTYLAVVHGRPSLDSGRIENNIGRHPVDRKRMAIVERGGKTAITNWRVIGASAIGSGCSVMEFRIETGRTHQIRVHAASLGCPIIGDSVYGKGALDRRLEPVPRRQMLHAWKLALRHPVTNERMNFEARISDDMKNYLETAHVGDVRPQRGDVRPQMGEDRRTFIMSLAALGLVSASGCMRPAKRKPLKFLFMTDHHVESDFIQSHGISKGEPVYTVWKPGNHAALVALYDFINSDPFCRDCDFALFGGDQINTGYSNKPKDMADELVNYHSTLEHLDLHAKTKGKTDDLDFVAAPWTVRENLGKGQRHLAVTPKMPTSRVIAIQGNHDTGVDEFYRDCAFTVGGVRFITFFASYVGLKPRPGERFRSTAKISDKTLEFVVGEMAKASEDSAIRHIVLASHWAIADESPDFKCPIYGACPENKMNDNRTKLLAAAEKYGCRLYINGHEHNGRYPVGKVGSLSDINCGTPTTTSETAGAFTIVEIDDCEARFHVYSRVKPRRLFTRTIPLK